METKKLNEMKKKVESASSNEECKKVNESIAKHIIFGI